MRNLKKACDEDLGDSERLSPITHVDLIVPQKVLSDPQRQWISLIIHGCADDTALRLKLLP